MTERQTYSKEFKIEAVRLLQQGQGRGIARVGVRVQGQSAGSGSGSE